ETPELICEEGTEMGTPFRICVYARPSERMGVRFDLQKSFRRLNAINSWMSDWIPGTELNKVNEAAGARPVVVRQELFDLLRFAREVNEATDGAFDPTFNAFWGLYSFKPESKREPTDEEIQDRLPLVNFRNVILDSTQRTVFLRKPGMKLGLGAIGQGYGVDQAVAELKTRYAAGFVDGSGDTAFWGKKPNGELWVTAIRDPRDKTRDIGRVVGTDFAVTTAGDDEKFFMVGDRRVHHILDPKTGRSATASRQVTVIARTATEADAFDTAAFVLGPEKGKKLLEARGLQGVFVSSSGVTMTKGLHQKKTQWGDVWVVESIH
ncbi:MAG: FAD:protein FMN transferase, partial [Bdellovibrionaceae bacterium]|nr:FAD:protein FMN transferase [Pseudobdellovibrionaceae bacterium]